MLAYWETHARLYKQMKDTFDSCGKIDYDVYTLPDTLIHSHDCSN